MMRKQRLGFGHFLLIAFLVLPFLSISQDPDIQDLPFSETIFRTSDQAGEQPTSPRRGPFHGTTKRVSAPRGAIRLGCLCMDDSQSETKSTGACSGRGGVRYWLYRTVEGDTFRLSTFRNQSHPQPLDASERSVLNEKTAKKSAAMSAGHALAYDLEHDRLRGAVARLLERHGYRRVQKSVFVGAHLTKKGWAHLLADLGRLTKGRLGAADSILVIPLAPEHVKKMVIFGSNIASAFFQLPALFFRTES